MSRPRALLALPLAGALLGACGGSGDVAPDAAGEVDATPATPDAMASDCPASLDYGVAAAIAPEAFWFGDQADPLAVVAYANITDEASPDEVQLELYRGSGAFAGAPIEVGTYHLTGDETQYATCGVCVLLVANRTGALAPAQATDDPDATYLATSGTVEIVQLQPALQVELRGVTFERVEIDGESYTSTATADGCGSQVERLAFEAAVEPWT
jgi:hypothetical protein